MSNLLHSAATQDEPRRDLRSDERAWIRELDDDALRRLACGLNAVDRAARKFRLTIPEPPVWRRPS